MRISEYEAKLAELREAHGDLEMVRVVEDSFGPAYGLILAAGNPFLIRDVHKSDEFRLGDVPYENNFIGTG